MGEPGCRFVTATSFNFLLMTVCGWVNRRQLATVDYLREENRVLREQLATIDYLRFVFLGARSLFVPKAGGQGG